MLVLSRNAGESLTLEIPPSDKPLTVEILVSRIDSGRVRIGTEAPPEVKVHRTERLNREEAA